MADYSALMRSVDASETPYYTFQPKLSKPMKAVVRHLSGDTPAKDISDELLALGFIVISMRQMTVSRPKAEDGLQTYNIPLFQVTHTIRSHAKYLNCPTSALTSSWLKPTEVEVV